MEARINRKKFLLKAFDLESHNDEESIAKQVTSMWLGCYIDENSKQEDESSYVYSIEEFLARLEADSSKKRQRGEARPIINICVYIYNLSFEWSFILPVLLERGFHFKERFEKDDEYVFNSVSTKSCSSVWQVQLKFSKKSGLIILKDLSKIYGGGLAKVAKSFNLPTQKGEIDYRLNRLHGHIVTPEEKEYCFKDTRIIIDILLIMKQRDDKTFFNIISMASYSMKLLVKKGWPRSCKPYAEYRKNYPELSKEENNFLRNSVSGGICYAPRDWQFKVISQKVAHIDKHQMHPSSAYFNLFPHGEGEYYKGTPPMDKMCCCHIKVSYDDVKLHSVIGLIGLDFVTERELYVWDFEIATMKKCYVNLEIEYIDGYAYKFKALPWKKYYSDNYFKRLQAKRDKDDFLILYYKLLNNSSYGKHLEKPHNQIIENTINSLGIIDSVITDKPEEECKANAKYTYLPVGSCIPAYSRVDLIETALLFGWRNIVYFDTDSIFFLWTPETEKVWNSLNQTDFLGGWGWEELIDRFQATAPKRYKLEVEGHTTIKAGGINFTKYMEENNLTEIPFDEVNIISSSWQVQRAYRVKGGSIIEFQTKDMKVQPKYASIYEKNSLE